MRRQIPTHQLLYNHLFPNPTATDPPNFTAHLARNLVPEVRIEVAIFYGNLNSVEARYPGLDYCYAPHRLRLGRFRHHRRLFRAFDSLGLTDQEIQDLCCWEGSKWARQKYEEDQGEKVVDTTGDDIGPWIDRRHMSEAVRASLPPSRKLLMAKPIPDERAAPVTGSGSLSARSIAASNAPVPLLTAVEDVLMNHWHGEAGQLPQSRSEIALAHARSQIVHTHSEIARTDSQIAHTRAQIAELRARSAHAQADSDSLHSFREQLLHALQSGRALSPELEAMVKDHVERGDLPQELIGQARDAILRVASG